LKSEFEVFLDTDIYLNHLSSGSKNSESLLLKCLKLFDCYSSVLNASEIFYGCRGNRQLNNAKYSFYGTGMLGIPYKYSYKIAEVLKIIEKNNLHNSYRDAVITAVCSETKLPLVTLNEMKYKSLFKSSGLKLIKKDIIIRFSNPEIIFNKAKIL
jgi:predicted nucleic acid-binding protein